MKNTKTIFIFCVLLLLLSSCKKKQLLGEKYVDSNTMIITVPDNLKSVKQSKVFKKIEFIPLETNDNCLIRDIWELKIKDSLLFINDANRSLLVFNRNGKFKCRLGKVGSGPGEYYNVRDFLITEDNVVEILDYEKIERYSIDGRYLSTKRYNLVRKDFYLNPTNFEKTDNGYYLWGGTFGVRKEIKKMMPNLMYRVDDEMIVQEGYLPVEHPVSTSFYRFHKYDNHIIIDPMFGNYNIYQIDAVGRFSSRYYVDFGKKAYAGKFTSKLSYDEVSSLLENYVLDMCNFVETDKWVHLNFTFNGKVYSLLYSKVKGESYILTGIKEYRVEDDLAFYGSVCAVDNRLVSIIPASWFKMEQERLTGRKVKECDLDKYASIKETDNPILAFYTMK